MTEVASVPVPSVPLTTVDNLFSITHLFFDQLRRPILLFAGTGMFIFGLNQITQIFSIIFLVIVAWSYNKFWINRKFYPSMQLMQGKTVLITGGSTGVGYETAKDLLRRGLLS